MIKQILLIAMLILVSGCAEMNSQFDCPMKGGVSCASLDQINAKVDRGEIGTSGNESIHKSMVVHTQYIESPSFVKQSIQKPKRVGEKVQHIWIAPFEDIEGNYHEESDIYTVIKPGRWIGYPVKAINNNEE